MDAGTVAKFGAPSPERTDTRPQPSDGAVAWADRRSWRAC